MRAVLNWNGHDVPEELKDLPTGRYVVVAVDDAPALTDDEDAGLESAIASMRAGPTVPLHEARQQLRTRLAR